VHRVSLCERLPVPSRLGMVGLLLASLVASGPSTLALDAPAAGPVKYYAEDIRESMLGYIADRTDADGVFRIEDDRTGERLELRFVRIHDPVRQIDAVTFFACTDFHVNGESRKVYDLDFWLRPEHGRLAVFDAKVHKEPRRSRLYGWYKHPRYTFVNDRVVELY
jgi:hypothetical protein